MAVLHAIRDVVPLPGVTEPFAAQVLYADADSIVDMVEGTGVLANLVLTRHGAVTASYAFELLFPRSVNVGSSG